MAALPDGTRIPLDDGKTKTFDERLANPDIEDLFRIPYQAGPILPVTTVDHDPGRVRIEAILAAAYGGKDVASQQVRVRFLGNPVRVHRKIASALARVEQRLVDASSVQPVSALTARFRGRRSCGIWFGRLCGQAHRGQDLLDRVVGLDQCDEAKRAFAARADRVDLERSRPMSVYRAQT